MPQCHCCLCAIIPSNKKENIWLNEIHPQPPPQRGLEVKIGDRIVAHDQEGNFLEELKVDEIGPVEERRMGSVVITLHRFTAVPIKSGDEDGTSEVEHPLTAPYESEDILANVPGIRDWFPRPLTPPEEA